MSTKRWGSWIAAVAVLVAGAAHASSGTGRADKSDQVLAALKRTYPGTKFTAVRPAPMGRLFEVWMGDNVAYVDPTNLRYLLFGHIFDARTMRDITAKRESGVVDNRERKWERAGSGGDTEAAVQWAELPIRDALTTVKGDGIRAMAVFTDPACGYCQRLEAELARLDNVTVHRFIVPFQGVDLPEAIWCAPDRVEAWLKYMAGKAAAMPPKPAACATPLERNQALARQMGVRGTPTIFFSDGTRTVGLADAAELDTRLAKATGSPASSDGSSRAMDSSLGASD